MQLHCGKYTCFHQNRFKKKAGIGLNHSIDTGLRQLIVFRLSKPAQKVKSASSQSRKQTVMVQKLRFCGISHREGKRWCTGESVQKRIKLRSLPRMLDRDDQ